MDTSGIPDFEELKINARIIDSEIAYLTKKVANPLNLGLSNDLEKSRADALEIINQIREELCGIRDEIKHSAEEEADALAKMKDDNENIAKYIEEIRSELDSYESQLAAFGYTNYVEEDDPGLDNPSDTTCPPLPLEKSLKYDTNIENVDPNRVRYDEEDECCPQQTNNIQHSQTPLGMKMITPLSRKWNRSFRNATLTNVSSDSSEVFVSSDILDKPHDIVGAIDRRCTMVFRGDDACKTPTDPGVSDVTMKLLGKNDLRFKIYQNPQPK